MPWWQHILIVCRFFQNNSKDLSDFRRSATMRPMMGLNLKPWPEQGETMSTFQCSSVQSIRKFSSLEQVQQQFSNFFNLTYRPGKCDLISPTNQSIFYLMQYSQASFQRFSSLLLWIANFIPSPYTSGSPNIYNFYCLWLQQGNLDYLYCSGFFIYQKETIWRIDFRRGWTYGTNLLIHLPQARATFFEWIYVRFCFDWRMRVAPCLVFFIDVTEVSSYISTFLLFLMCYKMHLMQFQDMTTPAYSSTKTFFPLRSMSGAEGKIFFTYQQLIYLMVVEVLATQTCSLYICSLSMYLKQCWGWMKVVPNSFYSSFQLLLRP